MLSKFVKKNWPQSLSIDQLKETAQLRLFGWLRIPLIGFLRPSIIESTNQRSVIKIPLSRRSKNHLSSMYFGALAVGADLCIGLLALKFISKSSSKISFVFKDFQAEFLRRPDSDVYFICEQGDSVKAMVKQATESKERVSQTLTAAA